MMSKALGVCLLLIGVQTIYTATTDHNACIEADNGISTPGLVLSNPETGDVIPAQHITEDYGMHQIQVYAYRGVDCDCKEKFSRCCVDINTLWLPNSTACVELVYLSNISSMNATVTLNKKDLMSQTFSVKNPVPLCVSIPYMPGAKICARVYDIALSGPYSSKACINLELWILGVKVYKVHFNCFQLGSATIDDDDY